MFGAWTAVAPGPARARHNGRARGWAVAACALSLALATGAAAHQGSRLGWAPTRAQQAFAPTCLGDWNGDGQVTVDELISAVRSALYGCGATPPCPGDLDGDGTVTIEELVTIVNVALHGCADRCAQAGAALGRRVCVHSVDGQPLWDGIGLPVSQPDQVFTTKYLSPARPGARLPTLFMDLHAYLLHYDFLVEAFPDLFAGLTHKEYNDLILHPELREFFAGNVSEYLVDGSRFFGFTVLDDPANPAGTVTYEQVLSAWQDLSAAFALGELSFVPSTQNQRSAAATWQAPFPIYGIEDALDYEAYTRGVGYGTMRLFTLAELAAATQAGEFGFRDILVLDEAPVDVERVVSGAVTGTRQGELSHLNVRSASRGTPNCYVRDPHERLADWEGQLVRMECGAEDLTVTATSAEEAQAWWDALRPHPVPVPAPDLEWGSMPGLLEVPTATAVERTAALTRFGAKGANLAVLYQRIGSELQLDGFLVPFRYYDAFMHSRGWNVDLGDGLGMHSFAETIAAWLQDVDFRADAALRRERLAAFRDAIRSSTVDPALIDSLENRILAVFGSDRVMVRFRSSSNAEDSLLFSGAGLYDSTSACLADERDGDDEPPSLCDPDQDDERTMTRALLKVWASLWNMEAFEERDWYGIDHGQVGMAVLVDTRVKGELANIVAFTGNPTVPGDDRFLVNAQAGELDVVSAEPGVVPEKRLLAVQDGSVMQIIRVSESSEVKPGEVVLTTGQLELLGSHLWEIAAVFPVDAEVPDGRELLLDSEWKLRDDGQLIVKQVRPFLR